MSTPTDIILLPEDASRPVANEVGELLQPVSVKGFPVRLRPPTEASLEAGKGYITISYYELGRRKNTSGGVTLDEALVTVAEVVERLAAGTVNAPSTMGELIQRYLDPKRPMRDDKKWSSKHRYNQERLAKLYVTPVLGKIRCKDITSHHCQLVVNKAPTQGEGKRVRILLGSILRYGIQENYLSKPVEGLIGKVHWQSQGAQVPEFKPGRRQGASSLYVPRSKIPTLDDIYELPVQFKAREGAPWWWEMIPIFVAFTGLRIGEVIGLQASDVDGPPSRRVEVARQFLEATQDFDLPKRGKLRTTRYPNVTPAGKHFPNGYPLGDMVAKRKAEVEKALAERPAEKGEPGLREGLMFPAPRGGPWSQSNLSKRLLRPSALDAGWPVDQRNRLKWAWHSLRHYFATYQLLERNIQPAIVSDAMGHSSVSITIDLYLNVSDDSWKQLD